MLPGALRYHNRAILGGIVGIYGSWVKAKVLSSFKEQKDIAANSDSEGNGEGNIGGVGSRELGDNTLDETGHDKGRKVMGLFRQQLLANDMRTKCIVSLETGSVDACDLLRPWTLEEDTLMRLEYMWGFKYRTLKSSLETSTINLSPELRRTFESDLWALLPLDVTLLETIINTDFTVDKPIETVYQGMNVFDYAFVPLPGLTGVITRLVEKDSLPDALPQEHTFPYTTLPVLHLQVQPHYVVFDWCRKILKHELIVIDIREETIYEPSYMKYILAHVTCRNLFDWWMTPSIPQGFINDLGDDAEGLHGQVTLRKRYPDNFVDKIALRPTDSVTHVPDGEDGEDSGNDDVDEFIVEESDSAFQVRMTR
ncbi:hypothetical protein C0993_010903, partial [Termitomyces sp. T159_Od127]